MGGIDRRDACRNQIDLLESRGIGKKRLQDRHIHTMAAAMRPKLSNDAPAGERQIADRVQNLVPDEFIGVAQPFRIEDPLALQGYRVLEGRAKREARFAEPLYIGKKAECPGAGQFAPEKSRHEIDRFFLAANGGAIEIDLDIEMQTRLASVLRRMQFAEAAPIGDPYWPHNSDVAARRRERLYPGLIDKIDKLRGRAVHDRNFRPIDLDKRVVDAEPPEGREQMLDGRDACVRPVTNHCAQLSHDNPRPMRGNRPRLAARKSGAAESNAGVGFGRMQNNGNGGI